ncbi:MAG: glutathione metabolism protein [Gammaproteobacteria bacterium]|nr:glutathione metabolism protein [Gammaproteobacteria bacterium]
MLITPIYAAVLALIFVGLAVRTLMLRRKLQVGIGTGKQPLLARAMRAHANFAEYVPIALLLIYFLELQIDSRAWIHVLCAALLAGRVIHAFGISQQPEDLRFRVTGMALTFFAVIAAAVHLLAGAIL